MATDSKTTDGKKMTNTAPAFRQLATRMATELLTDWVGEERAGEAVGRIGAALSSAAASAKKPEDFYSCTPASIANCVAVAALTGIMPSSGSAALAYLIPRSPRKGEQKQLGYEFSHRGLNALASRSGQIMVAIPISFSDSITVSRDGEAEVRAIDFDNPPTEFSELRGVMIVVKRIESGVVVTRGWMAKKLIEKRRDDSDSYRYALTYEYAKETDPWHKWPIEMAMKAAMHYAVSRGWCVIDDTSSIRALASETAETVSVWPAQSKQPALEWTKDIKPDDPLVAVVPRKSDSEAAKSQEKKASTKTKEAAKSDSKSTEPETKNQESESQESIIDEARRMFADCQNRSYCTALYDSYLGPESTIEVSDEERTEIETIYKEALERFPATQEVDQETSQPDQQGIETVTELVTHVCERLKRPSSQVGRDNIMRKARAGDMGDLSTAELSAIEAFYNDLPAL